MDKFIHEFVDGCTIETNTVNLKKELSHDDYMALILRHGSLIDSRIKTY